MREPGHASAARRRLAILLTILASAMGHRAAHADDDGLPLLRKMREVVIPQIAFSNATVQEVAASLSEASRAYAPMSWSAADRAKGINIVAIFKDLDQVGPRISASGSNLRLDLALEGFSKTAGCGYLMDGDVAKIVPADYSHGRMILRLRSVIPIFIDRVCAVGALKNACARESSDEDLPEFPRDSVNGTLFSQECLQKTFEELGVPFPSGSFIRYVPEIGQLLVRNTEANIRIFDSVMDETDVTAHQIRVECQWVEFQKSDIDPLVVQGKLDKDALIALRARGSGALIQAPQVLAQNGEEASIRAGLDVSYPTECTVELIAVTNRQGVSLHVATPPVLTEFVARETGASLAVVPEVSPDGSVITLTMTPKLMTLEDWQRPLRYHIRAGSLVDLSAWAPTILREEATTRVMMKDGGVIVAGGGMGNDSHHVRFCFVSADFIDPSGAAICGRNSRKGAMPARNASPVSVDELSRIVIREVDFRRSSAQAIVQFLNEKLASGDVQKSSGSTSRRAEKIHFLNHALSTNSNVSAHGNFITLTARAIRVSDVLKITGEIAGMERRSVGGTNYLASTDVPDGEIITGEFRVMPTLIEKLAQIEKAFAGPKSGGERRRDDGDSPNNRDMAGYMGWETEIGKVFGPFGVKFPRGSGIVYAKSLGKLFVTSTKDDLDRIEMVLGDLNVTPSQVEVRADLVEFPTEVIAKIAVEGRADSRTLVRLLHEGKGRIITSPRVIAQIGEESQVKTVCEPAGQVMPPAPTCLVSDELGTLFSVVTEVAPDGKLITLTLTPRRVEEAYVKRFEVDYPGADGKRHVTAEEYPTFFCDQLTTRVMIHDGGTVMIGGGTRNRTGDAFRYWFVTAGLLDVDGRPISSKRWTTLRPGEVGLGR